MPAGARPPFAWSVTRQSIFARCLRQYYLRYYGGFRGWAADATPEVRRAYVLGRMTDLALALGGLVHDEARRIAIAVRDRARVSTPEEIRKRIRGELNRLVISSRDVPAFLRDPQKGMLREIYYGGEITSERVAQITDRLERCSEALLRCPLWEDLRHLPGEAVLLIDGLELCSLDGMLIYAAPDVAYLADASSAVVVDFKTGSSQRECELIAQVAVYALALRSRLGATAPKRWKGRIILLEQDAEIEHDLTEEHFAAAIEGIRNGTNAMRALLAEPERNIPVAAAEFPMTDCRTQCQYCPFLEICGPEQGFPL